MVEITAWSANDDSLTNTPSEFLNTYNENKEALIEMFKAQLTLKELKESKKPNHYSGLAGYLSIKTF
jgi:hypothetical protein